MNSIKLHARTHNVCKNECDVCVYRCIGCMFFKIYYNKNLNLIGRIPLRAARQL